MLDSGIFWIFYLPIAIVASALALAWSQAPGSDGTDIPGLGAEGRGVLGLLLGVLWPLWAAVAIVGCVGVALFKIARGVGQLWRFAFPKSRLPLAKVHRK